jgi:hypothetical protein
MPSNLPRAAALQTVAAARSVPGTRGVPERGPIPDRGWRASPPAPAGAGWLCGPGQAEAGWASSGAGPVPLATARATAPHSGQTALRHFAPVFWLRAGLAKDPLTPQPSSSPFSPPILGGYSLFPTPDAVCLPEILTWSLQPHPISPETTKGNPKQPTFFFFLTTGLIAQAGLEPSM